MMPKRPLLQFEQDVSSAELAAVQARAGLRQLLGYVTVPEAFERGDLRGLASWEA